MKISPSIKKLKDIDSVVPVWSVTEGIKGCTHRFFDSSAFSPSGELIAVFQLPTELPSLTCNEPGKIWVINLIDGSRRAVGESRAWECQLGCNLHWGASDDQLFYNDIDPDFDEAITLEIQLSNNTTKKHKASLYDISYDGKWFVAPSLEKMRFTQPGYGYYSVNAKPNEGLVKNDGVYLYNTETQTKELLFSIEELVLLTEKSVSYKYDYYVFHTVFNPSATKILVQLRWFPSDLRDSLKPAWEENYSETRRSYLTIDLAKNEVFPTIPSDVEIKGTHHPNWINDEEILINHKIDGKAFYFVKAHFSGGPLMPVCTQYRGSGHPSYHSEDFILTDTYLKSWDFPQKGDGTIPIRWIDIRNNIEYTPIRVPINIPCEEPYLRVDAHPSFSRDEKFISFNAWYNDTRTVFIADVSSVIDRNNFSDKVLKKQFQEKKINSILTWIKKYFK